MGTLFSSGEQPRVLRPRGGFSLIELITALAVMSVAATLGVSLLQQSLSLGRSARNRVVASQLAEEQMAALQRHPERFQWPSVDQLAGQPFSIVNPGSGKDDYAPLAGPASAPLDKRARSRDNVLYKGFQWKATGHFPAPDSPYCEVSVEIRWQESGDPRAFVLTSALPVSIAQVPQVAPAKPEVTK
jgi:prepilin-type N-terminal cleavage/methylation domain-containing protein